MGGKYRITGDKYPRMRPTGGRRKLVLAATGGVLALGLVGWGTFQLVDVFTGGSTATAAGGKNCPAPATSVSPAKVTPSPPRAGSRSTSSTPPSAAASPRRPPTP